MALSSVLWKLASPYDAYVSHAARLNEAIARIRTYTDLVLRQEASLQASVRLVPGSSDAAARAARFREQLAAAAETMTDEQFEEFIAMLGGGEAAEVESARARAVDRMSRASGVLEELFAIAGHELAVLERRGYNPGRPDVARELRENNLPLATVAEYRHILRELGARVGRRPASG